jgi:hypothetical protein
MYKAHILITNPRKYLDFYQVAYSRLHWLIDIDLKTKFRNRNSAGENAMFETKGQDKLYEQ